MSDVRLPCGLIFLVLFMVVRASADEQSSGFADNDPGPDNKAFISQLGMAQKATTDQRNIAGGLLHSTIQQNGIGNSANVSLEGGDLSGGVIQSGNDNQATLEIRDEHNRGTIEQYGDGNSAGLRIDGYGKDVTLIQEGNGHAYAGPIRVGGDAPAGQMISIRQY